MSIFSFWRSAKQNVCPEEEAQRFRAALERERSRADRTGRAFSVVELRPRPDEAARWKELSALLTKRIRAYDLLGTNADGDLCVLLPETTGTEAWRFVDAIRNSCASTGLRFTCSVLEYPHWSWRQDDDESPSTPSADTPDAFDAIKSEIKPLELPREQATQLPLEPDAPHPNVSGKDARAEEEDLDDSKFATDPLESRTIQDLSSSFHVPVPWWKRGMDIILSGLALLLLSPLLMLIAIVIRRTSKGPVIFRQQRAGIGGNPFWFYKFRTMAIDAEGAKQALREHNEVDGPVFKIKLDPRITNIGRRLRKSSMDELPQLWNVFIGDMSLVGPRPPTLDEISHYHPWQRRRLHLVGGLTCFWQVSGRSDLSFEEWMRLDARYAKRPKFLQDVGLLIRTPWAILTGRGAY